MDRHYNPPKRSSKREQTYTAFCCPLSTGVKPEIAILYPSIFLIDKKQLSDLKVYGIVLTYSKQECIIRKYQDEIKYITEYPKRNNFIRNLCIDLKGNTLVLFSLIKHGELLYKLIKEKTNDVHLGIFFRCACTLPKWGALVPLSFVFLHVLYTCSEQGTGKRRRAPVWNM